jgi:hypothetical protein
MKNIKLSLVAVLGIVVSANVGAIFCVQCGNLPQCASWGSTIGGPIFCGSEDVPTGCNRYTNQQYNCNEGGTGWQISSNLQVGDTCTAGTDCF